MQCRTDEADREEATPPHTDTPHFPFDLSQSPKDLACLLCQKSASIGQFERALAAQQKSPALRLEHRDAPAERRLRHVQTLGSTGEAPGLSHSHKVAQIAKLHRLHTFRV